MKTTKNAYLLWLFGFFGIFGLQQFYLGKTGKGVAYIFTAGFWGVGALIDLFTLGKQVDAFNDQLIKEKSKNNSIKKEKTTYEDKPEDVIIQTLNKPTSKPKTTKTNTSKIEKQKTTHKAKKANKPTKELIVLGHVEQKGSTIISFDNKGKRIKNMSSGGGELKGHGTDFFVLQKGRNTAVTYDANCKQIKAINIADKEIVSVGGDSFTTRKGNIVNIFDKKGKLISTKKV